MVAEETAEFFKLGLQCYVTARFSAFAWLNPVCGNLFHHAIEMFLKGHLAAHMNLASLKKRYGHGLTDLWNAYKTDVNDHALNRFDDTIARLDEFESIRYPDRILSKGMQSTIAFTLPVPVGDPNRPEPPFLLVVAMLDELVSILFQKGSINPAFFINSFPAPAIEYLQRDNVTPLA